MININKFKFKKSSLSTIKPATDKQIAELEDYCGHKLPESYKEILKDFNGGLIKYNYVDFIDGVNDIHLQYRVSRFLILDENKNRPVSLWWHLKNYANVIGSDSVPFADDGLHQIYYIKWINHVPQVWFLKFLDLEVPETCMVSESFDKLLGDLYAED